MDLVAKDMDRLEKVLSKDDPNTRKMEQIGLRLQAFAIEHANGVVPPIPAAERHKQSYTLLIEFQVRKIEDLLFDDGRNYRSLCAEEKELMRQAEFELESLNQELQNSARELGISPLNF